MKHNETYDTQLNKLKHKFGISHIVRVQCLKKKHFDTVYVGLRVSFISFPTDPRPLTYMLHCRKDLAIKLSKSIV